MPSLIATPNGVKSPRDHANGQPPDGRDGRVVRVGRVFLGYTGVVGEVAEFLADYMVMAPQSFLVVSAWVAASWLADQWDMFPHLAVTSPEKRCGKTRLFRLLKLICPRADMFTNISPAAMYRTIAEKKPTLLIDEAQSLGRLGSESSEVVRELLNSSIERDAKTMRCGGKNNRDVENFGLYCPKAIALIGNLDAILADRCLPIRLERNTDKDAVKRAGYRVVNPVGFELHEKLRKWAAKNGEKIAKVYDALEPFDIENDRMADLLMPLQAVLDPAAGGGGGQSLEALRQYAEGLEEMEKEPEKVSLGVQCLLACREVFVLPDKSTFSFLATSTLIDRLKRRLEEPWGHYPPRGEAITDAALASLLRPYGIKPGLSKDRTCRGYYLDSFRDPWERYIPQKCPSKPSHPSEPSTPKPSRVSKVSRPSRASNPSGISDSLQRLNVQPDGREP
jgi:hypothetical protein